MTCQEKLGFKSKNVAASKFEMGHRRAQHYDIEKVIAENDFEICEGFLSALNKLDIAYRSLCAILFNFVPKSGHPGGSISSGRIVQALMFGTMDYNLANPDARDADQICYAAGHKAMGLYAAWSLRNECARISRPALLPDEKYQLRLEDLLGFRRNPTTAAPLFRKHRAKPLDGHPTPTTPFVKLATGASGVGVTAGVGLAFGMLDTYGPDSAPWVHMIEGEGGMTPGRVHEAMGAAGSNQIKNIVMHVDWNQASIDSNRVCRDGQTPGEYVQWNPVELGYLHDWNVIFVKNGHDFKQILAAQYLATQVIKNHQPTLIAYRTTKGWRYGIEGRASHGAGHDFCSEGFYKALAEFEETFKLKFPRFDGDKSEANIEQKFYDSLLTIRKALEANEDITNPLSNKLERSAARLTNHKRTPRSSGPKVSVVYEDTSISPEKVPSELLLKPGQEVTQRGVLGSVLNWLNHKTSGAVVGSSADLFGSTNLADLGMDKSKGYFNLETNPSSRLIMLGGICEDAIGGFMAGLSTYGNHVGVGSSYGAFIAALQHVPARLHAIGQESRLHAYGDPRNPFVIICGHAGPKTGEDGPTHADPQALQLLQENFPPGSVITLTPWDTAEMWPLMIASLKARPAVISPFVTRPSEKVVDRAQYRLPPAVETIKGVYAFRRANPNGKKYHGTIVIQGNGVTHEFVQHVLPKLDEQQMNINVFYISSAELFNRLPQTEQDRIFPESLAREAMGITEFTAPTLYRWVTSHEGRRRTIHPFAKGHFLGSGQADKVFREGGLDGAQQLSAVLDYCRFMEKL